MYGLSVGAIFRNEENIIIEWIKHYLHHGVEHFYLINDNSDDNSIVLIQEYIDKNIITLFNADWSRYLGRQKDMYNEYILPHIKETEWLLMVDLDEFVWSLVNLNLYKLLNEKCSHLAQIQIEQTLFGSNGHITQPNGIVKNFTKRSKNRPTKGLLKYIVNTKYEFRSLTIHHAHFINQADDTNHEIFIQLHPPYFIMNHYNCQSRYFWNNVKCKRGDSDNYRIRKEEDFKLYDINEVDDYDLLQQNINII